MYTYAFLESPQATLQLPTGMVGRLELVHSNQMAALTEPDADFERIQADDNELVQAAMSHDRVMCAVFEQVPLIPLQFGTCFHSRQRLLDHLAKHQDTYLSKLDMLADCVEYCCKLTLCQPNADIETAYEIDRSQAVVEEPSSGIAQAEKNDILARIAQTYPRYVAHTQGDTERAYVLIQRAEAIELEEKVSHWRSQLHNWKLELGQPLPPYHFV